MEMVHNWQVPNAIGFVLGMAQLVLYAIYSNPEASTQMAADLDDGWQTEPLLNVPEQKWKDIILVVFYFFNNFLFYCII